MSLLARIKATQLQARKDRNSVASSLLSTLLGEAIAVGKNAGNREPTDIEIVVVVKKFIENSYEMLNIVQTQTHANEQRRMEDMGKVGTEIGILKSFLPTQLTDDELSAVIDTVIASVQAVSIKDMGKVMKGLKEGREGTYDGALAGVLVKAKLTAVGSQS